MPTTTYARMTRSDHSMRPPAPASSLAYGSPNACNGCHAYKSASWADRQARQWFRRGYQAPILERAVLINAARKQDWSKLSTMLAAISTESDEVFRASLIRLLAECRDERRFPALIPALLRALQDSSPMVRASAVDALADHVRPDTIGPLTGAAADSFRTVRIRAGAALAALDQSAAVDAAIGEYVQSMRSYPDDYAQRMNLGVFHADRGQWNQALAEYAQAMRLRPAVAPPLVNAALVYNQLGRNAEAETALRKAISIDPNSAAAHLNLGLLLAEMGRVVDAETALRRSLDLDKTNPAAAYNLAVIVGKERPAEAAKWCRIAVENAPGEPKYSYTLAYFLSKSGDLTQAISVLEQARARHAIESNGINLLNELYSARSGSHR
jgi:Flp pilus assembly protein TadD